MKLKLFKCMLVIGIGAFQPVDDKKAWADNPPRGYEENVRLHQHGFRFSIPGEPVRRGQRSERFELRSGDCGGKDCRNYRLRAEFREKKRNTTARIGKDVWYGWSFRIGEAPHLPGRQRLYPFFGQWKMGGDNPPILSFIQSDHGRKDTIFASLNDMSVAGGGTVGPHKHGNICKDIFSISAAKKQWVDIVLNTNFAADATGYLKIWVNESLKCNYRGQLTARTTKRYYPGPNHRRGIYVGNTRTWVSEFGKKPTPTWVVYYDEFLSGSSREEVDTRLRQQKGFPPVD